MAKIFHEHSDSLVLTRLKDIPVELVSTNRGAVVQLTDEIFKEAHLNLPKRLVSRLALADDLITQAYLKENWIEAQRAMQLEDSFIKEIPELAASCFPWCKRQVHAIEKRSVKNTLIVKKNISAENISAELKKDKAASYLFKTATTKPLTTQPPNRTNKQPQHNQTLLSAKVNQSIKVPVLFQRREIKPVGKHLGTAVYSTPKLISEKNTHFPYQNVTRPGISGVTATSEATSTFLLLDTLVRAWTGNHHRPIPPSPHTNKAERQIQSFMERKP